MIIKKLFLFYIFTLILSGKTFQLNIPQTQLKITLQQEKLTHYEDEEEKGVVYGDFLKIQYFKDIIILPFVVSNQGTGIFYYLGIFKKQKHITSLFIGDRIKIKTIQRKNNIIKIKYITREGSIVQKIFNYTEIQK